MSESVPTSERDALRIQLGLSVARLARDAGISVDTATKILKGQEGQATKVHAIDDALSKAAQEKGLDAAVVVPAPRTEGSSRARELADEGLMEFEVGGNFGVSVVVRGPVANHEEMESAVLRLVQGMNAVNGANGGNGNGGNGE